MDEKAISKMFNDMKNELITQLKTSTDLIRADLKEEIKQSEANIKKEIIEVKQEVSTNKSDIEDLKTRLNNIEQKVHKDVTTFADAAKKPPIVLPKKDETKDEMKIEDVIKAAKLKIGISPITLDDLNRIAAKEKVKGEAALNLAVKEFLLLELKMDEEELKQLGEFKAHRKNNDENEKVYLNFTSE